jgi:hypothetical protein
MSVKEIKFNLAKSGTNALTVTKTAVNVSQYEQVKIVVQLDPAFYDKADNRNVVSLNLEPPSSVFSPASRSDYSIKVHLIPDPSAVGLFYVWLGGLLKDKIQPGNAQGVYYNFAVTQNEGTEYDQPIALTDVIEIYKTNTQYSYSPDDFENLFVSLNDIKTKWEAL